MSMKMLRKSASQDEECLIQSDRIVSMNNSRMDKLPESFFLEYDASFIAELRLSGCGLTELSGDISNLVNLKTLYLPNNNLSILPNEITYLTRLEDLNCCANKFSNIPPPVFSVTSLKQINFGHNGITVIPKDIKQLILIEKVVIYANRIQFLPKEIGQLQHLHYLSLDANLLEFLPKEICNLRKLKSLLLSSNKLLSVPMLLGYMDSLEYLYLDNNMYFNYLPGSLIQRCSATNAFQALIYKCSKRTLPTDHLQGLCHLEVVNPFTDEKKMLVLPPDVQRTLDISDPVSSLMELAAKVVGGLVAEHPNINFDLPLDLCALVAQPMCKCLVCQSLIYCEGFPVICYDQVDRMNMFDVSLVCSLSCFLLTIDIGACAEHYDMPD